MRKSRKPRRARASDDQRVTVTFTAREYARIAHAAEIAGVSRSAYVRALVLHAERDLIEGRADLERED